MYYICIDIGGTSIKYAILDKDGEIFVSGTIPTRITSNGNHILKDIKKLTGDLLEQYRNYKVKGICVSSAGVVDPDKGEIIFSGPTIPGYKGTKIKKEIEKIFNIPCEVENDVNCAALGEYWKGAGKGAESMVCMTIGTGIGGAIILNGKLLNGTGYTAGEIGYMEINGEHIQNIASARSLVETVQEKKEGKGVAGLTGLGIFELAKQGDKDCIEAIDTVITNLSIGIRNIIYLLNPEIIVIGGGIAEQREYLEERIRRKVDRGLIGDIFKKTVIKMAQKGNHAGMLGALYGFLNKHR